MEKYWKTNENGRFKWTGRGVWEIVSNFMAIMVGIGLWYQVAAIELLVDVLAVGFIVIGIIGIIELVLIKWRNE